MILFPKLTQVTGFQGVVLARLGSWKQIYFWHNYLPASDAHQRQMLELVLECGDELITILNYFARLQVKILYSKGRDCNMIL